MYSVIITHTVCIIFIEIYNWFYLVKADKQIKKSTLGAIYQVIKFVVLFIDILMVYQLWSFIHFYLTKARGFSMGEKKFLWVLVQVLLSLNILWFILRCFVRNISAYLEDYNINFFEYIHAYRYAIQSVFDLLNGGSILYGLFIIAQFNRRKRESSITFRSNSTSNKFYALLKQASLKRLMIQKEKVQLSDVNYSLNIEPYQEEEEEDDHGKKVEDDMEVMITETLEPFSSSLKDKSL